MYNWNAHVQGAGFPMQPPQMMQFPGAQVPFAAQQMSFQPQQWAQQPPSMAAGHMGMMIGQAWPPNTPQVIAHQGMGAVNMPIPGMMTGINPAPPAQPPPDEKPPLPSEPPPPLPSDPNEQPQPPPDTPKPPLPGQTKDKWDSSTKDPKSSFQSQGFPADQFRRPPPTISKAQPMPPQGPPPSKPMPPQGPPPSQPMPPQGPLPGQPQPPVGPPPGHPTSSEPVPSKPLPQEKPSPDPALLSQLEKVYQEEKMFLEQYKQWKKQYDDWREQNQNHPNKEQFMQYLDQWKTYEQQMEARRKTIESQKNDIKEKIAKGEAISLSSDSKPEKTWLKGFVKSFSSDSQGSKSRWDKSAGHEGVSGSKWNKSTDQRDAAVSKWDKSTDQGNVSSSIWDKSAGHGDTSDSRIAPDSTGSFQHTESSDTSRANAKKESAPVMNNQRGQFDSTTPGGGVSFHSNRFEDRCGSSQSVGVHGSFDGGRGGGRETTPVSGTPAKGPGMQDEEKGEEDMNLDDEEESGGGGIIESSDQLADKPDPWVQNLQGPGAGWNSWDSGPDSQTQGPWNSGPGGFQNNPGNDWFNQNAGPGSLDGPNNFRGRGRGPWNGPNIGSRPPFGIGGPGMNQGQRFQAPSHGNDMTQSDNPSEWEENPQSGGELSCYGDDNQGFDNDQGVHEHFYGGRGQFHGGRRGDFQRGRGNFQRGQGNDFQRGRGIDFQRGRGGDFQRGRGGEFQRGRGGDFQRGRGSDFQGGRGTDFQGGRGTDIQGGRGTDVQGGRGSDFQGGRGNEFQRGRGGDFQRGHGGDFQRGHGGDFQRGRGGDFQRGRGEFQRGRGEFQRGRGGDFHKGRGGHFQEGQAEQYNEFTGSDFGIMSRGGFRGRGIIPRRGRGGPPSLLSFEFNENMKEKFSDFDPSVEEEGESDYPAEGEENYGYGEEEGGDFQDLASGQGYNDDSSSFSRDENFAQHGKGRGDRGRGFMQHGRGQSRGRGGYMNQRSDMDFQREEEMGSDFDFVQRGRGGMRGRGARGGRQNIDEGFYQSEREEEGKEWNESRFDQRARGGFNRGRGRGYGNLDLSESFQSEDRFNNRGRGGGRGQGPARGRGHGMDFRASQHGGQGDFCDNTQQPQAGNESYPPFETDATAGRKRLPDEDEPETKKGRFDSNVDQDGYDLGMKERRFEQDLGRKDDRREVLPPSFPPPYSRDVYDPLNDPYRRYPDPYYPDEYVDPYAPLPPYGYDRFGAMDPRYDPPPPERRLLPLTESIDYAHGGVAKDKKAFQPAEVIDYGHGQTNDSKPTLSAQERERVARLGVDLGSATSSRDYGGNRRTETDRSPSREDSVDCRGPEFDSSSRNSRFRDHDVEATLRDIDIGPLLRTFGLDASNKLRAIVADSPEKDSDFRGESSQRDFDYGRKRLGEDKERMGRDRYGKSREEEDYDRAQSSSRYGSKESDKRSSDRLYGISRNDPVSSKERDLYSSRDDDKDDRRGRFDSSYSSSRRDGPPGSYDDSSYGIRDPVMRDRYGDPYDVPSRDRYGNYSGNPFGRDSHIMGQWGDRDRYGRPLSPPGRSSPPVKAPPPSQAKAEVVKVEDLLCSPGRETRPPQIVTIIRGLPGSGKTYVSKLLREKEISFGGTAPRVLCLDDYFMVEVDKEEVDEDTGKKVKRKVLEYEYEQALEEAYRQSLLKSFKKTVDHGLFPFIILDATNEKVAHFSEFWSYAKSKGFQVYVGELKADIATCIQRNIHHWTEWDIEKVKNNWEPLPNHYIRLDLRWLLQEDSIPEVIMEDTEPDEEEEKKAEEEEEEETGFGGIYQKSKWELDTSEKTLDKLDGIRVSKKHIAEHQSLDEYLQLDDDYFSRESLPGKKRVRWADLEEKKNQNRRRDLGFIVGQTQQDWERITDDDYASKALNQTKYYYKN